MALFSKTKLRELKSNDKAEKKHSILIVDDEEGNLKAMKSILEDTYCIFEAMDGERALILLNQLAPKTSLSMVISDQRMPKMTGYEACKVLKSEEKTKDIPVVFLSAKGQEAEVNAGLDLGAEEYFLKPFAPDDLSERVNKILTKYGKL